MVAELDGCKTGRYGRAADLPKMAVGVPVHDAALERQAIDAFDRLPELAEQEGDELSGEKHAEWWKGLEEVAIYKHPTTGKLVISVSADTDGTCGEFDASQWQTWTYDRGKLIPLDGGSPPDKVLGAVDANGDGTLDLLVKGDAFGDEAELVDARTLRRLVTLSYAYHDCPC